MCCPIFFWTQRRWNNWLSLEVWENSTNYSQVSFNVSRPKSVWSGQYLFWVANFILGPVPPQILKLFAPNLDCKQVLYGKECPISEASLTKLSNAVIPLGEDVSPEVKVHACIAISRSAKNEDNRRVMHEQEMEKVAFTLNLSIWDLFCPPPVFYTRIQIFIPIYVLLYRTLICKKIACARLGGVKVIGPLSWWGGGG